MPWVIILESCTFPVLKEWCADLAPIRSANLLWFPTMYLGRMSLRCPSKYIKETDRTRTVSKNNIQVNVYFMILYDSRVNTLGTRNNDLRPSSLTAAILVCPETVCVADEAQPVILNTTVTGKKNISYLDIYKLYKFPRAPNSWHQSTQHIQNLAKIWIKKNQNNPAWSAFEPTWGWARRQNIPGARQRPCRNNPGARPRISTSLRTEHSWASHLRIYS